MAWQDIHRLNKLNYKVNPYFIEDLRKVSKDKEIK